MENSFIKLPKSIINSPEYCSLSAHAVLLYAILSDRMSISEKNGWRDREGKTFVYCSREEAKQRLHCGYKAVNTAFEQLTAAGLISEVKQGRGLPNRIYPNAPETANKESSRTVEREIQEPSKGEPNNTEKNKNDRIKTENKRSVCRSGAPARERGLEEILSGCDMTVLNKPMAELTETVITRMYYSDEVKSGRERLPRSEVRRLLSRLNTDHLIELGERLLSFDTEIINPSEFLKSMIVNVITEEPVPLHEGGAYLKNRQIFSPPNSTDYFSSSS